MSRRVRDIVEFNRAGRDRWVAAAASRVPNGAKVLDVGAGPCRYRSLFAHCEYQTQDFCQYQGKRTDGVQTDKWAYGTIDHVSEITAIPVEDNTFDALLCTEVLEHVPEPIPALAELGRILKPGGTLLLTAPLGSGLHQRPYHYYGGYTPHFYERFLPQAGFEVVSIEPNGGFYRHLLQELHRAAGLIQKRRRYGRLHPAYWLLRLGFSRWLPLWLDKLDDEELIEDFTIGYHVEARKVGGADA